MNLKSLQAKLREHNLQALLVTRNNMFLGEDVLPDENKIFELTGFSGSAGMLLVLPNKSFLLVDGRYQIQARKETNSAEVTVIDCVSNPLAKIGEICCNQEVEKLSYNPWCLSINNVSFLKTKYNLLLDAQETLLGAILSDKPVKCFSHLLKYAGKTKSDKCAVVAGKIPIMADAVLICSADQVSWLTNMRSNALADTPILRAFALLHCSGEIRLFADNCDDKEILPLSELPKYLQEFKGQTIIGDKNTTPQKILDIMPPEVKFVAVADNVTALLKTAKNNTEIEGFRQAHIRDGVAVTKFLYWLENNWQGKSELDVVNKLHEYRSKQDLFYSESFATIAATGANAAIVHYQPTVKSNTILQENSVLLLDSGGQYYDGTTDVTRTIALGNPSQEIIDSFTQVLKAHICLASQIFPVGTSGCVFDALARSVMWNYGKNYKHGTGHGVGHFSNVHESPLGFSEKNQTPVYQNYVISNEPGYYKEGKYGIRIENLLYTLPVKQEGFLKFKNLTLIPIDKRLINAYLLSIGEQNWLNDYHKEVFDCLAPFMDTKEKQWLKSVCSPI